jgi:hypothetical protein
VSGMLWWEWLVLFATVVGLLAVDLFVFHRTSRRASLKEAAAWTFVWIALGLTFVIVVLARLGSVLLYSRAIHARAATAHHQLPRGVYAC